MKKFVFIYLIFLSAAATGQKMPSDYFAEATTYVNEKRYDSALVGFQYIVDHHPRNELYPAALYNVGNIHYLQKNFDGAIPLFKKILESKVDEKAPSGQSFMGNPYANYKHRVSRLMSDVYYQQEQYDQALHYLALSNTTYPFLHFCGNEYSSHAISTALQYSDIHQKLGQKDQAIQKLLPVVFENLSNNSAVLEELHQLLSGKKGIKKEFDKALRKMHTRTIIYQSYTFEVQYIDFLGATIKAPDMKTVKIRKTNFYKMLEQL